MSRRAVSGETFVSLAHFDNVSLPSKPSRSRLNIARCRSFNRAGSGDYVAGSYSQRFSLASGRFAMIDDGLGFQLVPWTPSLEKQIGRHVSGIARDDGGIDWSVSRRRGLGL